MLGWYGDGGDGLVGLTPVRRFDSRSSSPIAAGADVELYAAGQQPSRRTSNLNLRPRQAVANLAVVPVDSQGRVVISVSQGAVNVVLDVVGYYTPSSTHGYEALTPARTYDTRSNSTPPRAGADRDVRVLGLGGVPSSGVDSVLVNVTSVGSTKPADLQVYPAGAKPSRRTSNLNVLARQSVPVLVLAKVGANGAIALSTSQGQMDVVLDVVGWVRSG